MTRTMTATVVAMCVAGVLASAQTPARRAQAAASAPAQATTALNLNTATSIQLEALPGIGKATADRIIEYRQKSGSFKKVEELMNVRGIGEKGFLKLKPLVTVGVPKSEREP